MATFVIILLILAFVAIVFVIAVIAGAHLVNRAIGR